MFYVLYPIVLTLPRIYRLLQLLYRAKIYKAISESGTYCRLGLLLDNPVTESIISLIVFFENTSVPVNNFCFITSKFERYGVNPSFNKKRLKTDKRKRYSKINYRSRMIRIKCFQRICFISFSS
jgi:hypothetical protein